MNYGAYVHPRRSLVGSPNFEFVTPFDGMATSLGDRRIVKNDAAPPSAKIGARGNAYLTIKSLSRAVEIYHMPEIKYEGFVGRPLWEAKGPCPSPLILALTII